MAICMTGPLLETPLAQRATSEGKRIAKLFKELRGRIGMTQEDTARSVGLTLSGYRTYEQGKRQLRMEQLPTFAKAFGISEPELAHRLGFGQTPDDPDNLRPELIRYFGPDDAGEVDQLLRELAVLPPTDRRQIIDGIRDQVAGRQSRLGRA